MENINVVRDYDASDISEKIELVRNISLDRLKELVENNEKYAEMESDFWYTPQTKKELMECIEDMTRQFAYPSVSKKRACLTHGGLSALEESFAVLGWDNPHPVPEIECEHPGCHEHGTCGTFSPDGYRRCCGKHFKLYEEQMHEAQAAWTARKDK